MYIAIDIEDYDKDGRIAYEVEKTLIKDRYYVDVVLNKIKKMFSYWL